jgi:F-type H+-transporting ATPase subunit b
MGFLRMLAQEGEHAAPAGAPTSPFEVNFGLFFWTWVVFFALFFVLKRFAWPQILKTVEERERRIQNQLAEAERLNAEAKAAFEKNQYALNTAHDQAVALLNEAKAAAQKEREAALRKTREEQEQMLDRARKEIEAEKARAIAELRREAVDLSLAAASKLMDEKMDSDANRKLVTEYLSSVSGTRH